jgi:hypothetical protein
MRKIFTIEKVLIHTENMDFTGVKIRIKLFGYIVISHCLKRKLNTA